MRSTSARRFRRSTPPSKRASSRRSSPSAWPRAGCCAAPPAALGRRSRRGSIDAARQALYASKITSYAQGMAMLRIASARIRVRARPGDRRQDLARRLHHPREPARRHPPGVRARAWPGEPAARPGVPRRHRRAAGWLAALRADRGRPWHPGAGDERLAGLLRLVPQRAPARQPDAGAARFLRRAYLPPHRSRRVVPHGLDDEAAWSA